MASILRETNNYVRNQAVPVKTADMNGVLKTVSTRWKMMILFNISLGHNQYTKLKAVFPTATNHILIKRLRELEAEKFIAVEVENIGGIMVINYGLTTKSLALLQIMKQLQQWGTHWQG